jgi:hypothetical protein
MKAAWSLLHPLDIGQKLAVIIANFSAQLAAFDRYERRALSRRKFAIRQLTELRE